MKFCNAPNCSLPVFGKGYCRNHQYMREDFDRRSIVQRGIDRHKKEQEKKRKAGWFDVENHFSDGMVVFDLPNDTYTNDGVNWVKINIDNL